ncbi:MAG: VWA domain-containing protein [Limnobacter sp.]|nr:VWA domain-containing protein [Limnobacter sp.]
MAEAEDVITDVARHATIYARGLWRRYRPPPKGPRLLELGDVAERLDLLLVAAFGRGFALRVAQPPAPPTWLARLMRRSVPVRRHALPATDGSGIWLPAQLPLPDPSQAIDRYRIMAMQQAMRAVCGSASAWPQRSSPLLRDVYLLIEGVRADRALVRMLPGMSSALLSLRRTALAERPPLDAFAPRLQPLETLVRNVLSCAPGTLPAGVPECASAIESLAAARELAAKIDPAYEEPRRFPPSPLFGDCWTGELRAPPPAASRLSGSQADDTDAQSDAENPRSARLARRPEVREAADDEDDGQSGAWMVQTAEPLEQAEDPYGLQRPTDRDDTTAAEEFADAMSELPEARLVATQSKPREVLLSDDELSLTRARQSVDAGASAHDAPELNYPEWDWRIGAYREPGATVRLLPPHAGPRQWVDDTLAQHRASLRLIARQFEMLRARPLRLRRQLDGDEVDLAAWIDSHADYRAGLPRSAAVYEAERRSRRDMAIMLLIDSSGSTDGWISAHRRVIDVEREALLLVCIALESLAQPYSVLSFSGEGPQAVTLRTIKAFGERWDMNTAQRIGGLEPEQYTRAGAAIRHAATLLMRESAQHRLLLLLSDGKPNDVDEYEGRYGVEDMRQAVTEAKLQGIAPFCLTIDRQAAGYLPQVFGAQHYALLPRPEMLPAVLLDWVRRLVAD